MVPAASTSDAAGFPTNAQRLAAAADVLRFVTETPRLDAEILLAHTLGISRSSLLARLGERARAEDFDALVERRLAYEPLAYILGEWEFFSLSFKVVPPLLVPRPETEHLVECVIESSGGKPVRVLDVCTGTGCVAVSVAKNLPESHVWATDVSSRAIEVARENAARHGVEGRIEFRRGDLFGAFAAGEGPFEVICSNPPYVDEASWPALSPVIRMHEDPGALLAGRDGLDVVRRLIADAKSFLKTEGLLAFEIGDGQRAEVERILRDSGYVSVEFVRDLAGIDRIASARVG